MTKTASIASLMRAVACVVATALASTEPGVAQTRPPWPYQGQTLTQDGANFARGCLSWLRDTNGTYADSWRDAAEGLGEKLTPQEDSNGGQITTHEGVPRNGAFTPPDYHDGSVAVYVRANSNEIIINEYDMGDTYNPQAFRTPNPNQQASEIALASVLYHEYLHCLQERLAFAGVATCEGSAYHILVYDQQLAFLAAARAKLLLQQPAEEALRQLDKFIKVIQDERDEIEKRLIERVNANEC